MSAPWRPSAGFAVNGRELSVRAETWIKHRLAWRVRNSQGFLDGKSFDCELIDPMIEWYLERFTRYLDWRPHKDLPSRGRTGGWSFVEEAFMTDFDNAMNYAKARIPELRAMKIASQFKSLDDWLVAEAKGLIPGPGFSGGVAILTNSQQIDLYRRRNRVRDSWPVNCRDCGESFRPKRRRTVRCGCKKALIQTQLTDDIFPSADASAAASESARGHSS